MSPMFPLNITPKHFIPSASHSSFDISMPPPFSHMMSLILLPRICRPRKKFGRAKTGCFLRNSINFETNSKSRCCCSSRSQFSQLISLSWQYALLFPFCVRPYSSPPHNIGTPCDKNSVVMKLRICFRRNALISGSSVGPSAPQFHELLLLSPSLPPSPFASLCLSL